MHVFVCMYVCMYMCVSVQAFIKRLLQVSQLFSPPLVCASLILLSELVKTRPALLRLSKLAQVCTAQPVVVVVVVVVLVVVVVVVVVVAVVVVVVVYRQHVFVLARLVVVLCMF